jgi:hypothetical protein
MARPLRMNTIRKVGTMDCTPTWTAVMRVWHMIVNDAVRVLKHDQMDRFWNEIDRCAQGADKYGYLVEYLQDKGWLAAAIREALDVGKLLQEERRSRIMPVEEE